MGRVSHDERKSRSQSKLCGESTDQKISTTTYPRSLARSISPPPRAAIFKSKGLSQQVEPPKVVGNSAFERFLVRQAERFFEEVSLLIGDVVANGRSFDEQAGTAAVAGIFCGKVSRGPNDGFAHPLGIVLLVLHQKRRAREPGICQPLARDAGCLFQLSKKSEGVVHFALVVGDLPFGREESCELEFGFEGVGIARIPGEELLDGFPLYEEVVSRQQGCLIARSRLLLGTRVERYDMAPVLRDASA